MRERISTFFILAFILFGQQHVKGLSAGQLKEVYSSPTIHFATIVGSKKNPVRNFTGNKSEIKITKAVISSTTPQIKASVTTAVAYLKKNGKYIFVDSISLKPINEKEYDVVEDYSEGIAVVGADKRYGFIDRKGTEILPLKYEYAFSFKNGMAMVKLYSKWGCIDKYGKEIIPIKFEGIGAFNEGLAKVYQNKMVGFIDTKGNLVANYQYTEARDFHEGLALVDKTGSINRIFIDKSGKEILSLDGSGISDFMGGDRNSVQKNGTGVVDR